MRNMKKILALILALSLSLALSGCMYEHIELSLDSNGSGDVYGILGFTEDGLETLVMYTGGNLSDLDMDGDFEYFVIDGIEYYGVTDTEQISSIEDFNEMFRATSQDGIGQTPDSELTFGSMYIDKVSDEEWVLTISPATAGEYEQYGSDMKDMYSDYASDFKQEVILNLPGTITQEIGGTSGIKIDNNRLTITFNEMSPEDLNEKVFRISISPDIEVKKPKEIIHFNDVRLNQWYYDAVMLAANQGIISGYGNYEFGPTDKLTVAQFSQIIYNYVNGKHGDNTTDYWAESAVRYCLNAGIISDHGEINSKHYDIEITREEAVAGLAKGLKNIDTKYAYTLKDISDGDTISDEYKDNIVRAFNIGLTTGVDSTRRFLPKNTLTRAEVCQLLYNVSK